MTPPGASGLVDLSQPVAHDGPGWAEYDPPNVTRNFRRAVEGFNAETVRMATHTGTHVDVPFHFDDDGETIDQRPLESFTGPAVFLDLRGLEPDSPIGPGELDPVADAVQSGDIAVLVTGWGRRRGVNHEFMQCWPYLSGDGARDLVERGIDGVGIDALSIGGWGAPEKGQPAHEVLLGEGKLIIEDMRIPDVVLDGRRWFITAFPILLEGCGGAWTRAVAWPRDES